MSATSHAGHKPSFASRRLVGMRRALALAARSLGARPTRTALTAFGVTLGVAVIFAINTTNLSTLDAITSIFTQTSGKAHLLISAAGAGAEGFPADVLARVEATDGVRAAIPVLHGQATLTDAGTPDSVGISMFGMAPGGLLIYGVDPARDALARDYKLVAGEFLASDDVGHRIVLVQSYADEQGIAIGDAVSLETPAGRTEVRVVGLMAREGPGQTNNGAFGVVPLAAAEEIFRRAGDLDQIDVVAQPGAESGAGLEALKDALQERLGARYVVTYPAMQGQRVSQMLTGYQMGLNMFSAIAIFVGAFLVFNAFSMTVVERTREIGMLRTLGMSRRQILEQILVEATIIGVIGSILGILGGLLLARGLISIMALVIGQEMTTLRVPMSGVLVAAAVGILVTLAAAALPARQASRVSPLEALRIRAGSREGWFVRKGPLLGVALLVMTLPMLIAGPLPAFVPERARDMLVMNLFLAGTLLIPAAVSATEPVARRVLARVFGVEGQLGSRNVQRARLRTALTVAALMIGAAMILSIRSVTVAFDQDIRAWIERYIGGDIYVHSTLDMDTRLGLRLGQVAGVAAVTPLRYLEAKRIMPDGGSEDLAIMAVDVPTYQEVTSFVFSGDPGDVDRLARGDAVFISSVLSEKYGLQQGDTVRLATRRGRRDFEVAGVVVDFFNQGMVLQLNWDDMKRYFGRDDANSFLVKVQPGESTAAVRVRIEEEYGRRHHLTVESNEAIRSRALTLIARTTSLFDVMSLITMIVAALGVINTLTMNVVERTREIGMLRSLGMTRRQIGRMILAEAGMMGLVGGLFGLLFGILVSRTIMTSMNQMSGFRLPWVLPVEGIVAALVITFVVSQIAALWPARRAARIRITEAIQYE